MFYWDKLHQHDPTIASVEWPTREWKIWFLEDWKIQNCSQNLAVHFTFLEFLISTCTAHCVFWSALTSNQSSKTVVAPSDGMLHQIDISNITFFCNSTWFSAILIDLTSILWTSLCIYDIFRLSEKAKITKDFASFMSTPFAMSADVGAI